MSWHLWRLQSQWWNFSLKMHLACVCFWRTESKKRLKISSRPSRIFIFCLVGHRFGDALWQFLPQRRFPKRFCCLPVFNVKFRLEIHTRLLFGTYCRLDCSLLFFRLQQILSRFGFIPIIAVHLKVAAMCVCVFLSFTFQVLIKLSSWLMRWQNIWQQKQYNNALTVHCCFHSCFLELLVSWYALSVFTAETKSSVVLRRNCGSNEKACGGMP